MNTHYRPEKSPAKSKMAGFTMIEVLVTMIVLAVGLLGIAALQIVGLRSTGGSENRTQATLFANEIAERMRTNISAVNSGQFAGVSQATINCATPPAKFCSDNNTGNATVACTPTEMAAFDLKEWYCGVYTNDGVINKYAGGVANTLPTPSASITCPAVLGVCPANSLYTITVGWSEQNANQSAGAAATVNQSISLAIRP